MTNQAYGAKSLTLRADITKCGTRADSICSAPGQFTRIGLCRPVGAGRVG